MSIEVLTRAELAAEQGLVDRSAAPSRRAVARLIRAALARWGLCPTREVLAYARGELRACGLPTDLVRPVLDQLIAHGECEEVGAGGERLIAPAEPRWIDTGGRTAAVLGPLEHSRGLAEIDGLPPDDIVVRVSIAEDEQIGALDARAARQLSIAEWLRPLGYLTHVMRREAQAVRADRVGLAQLWERLESTVVSEGLPLGPDAEVRVLVGTPGGHFGDHASANVEGRWSTEAPSGVWCAYRRGHGEAHWLPTLISVEGETRRAHDLFDSDEWRWALLARAKAVGEEEVVRRTDGLEAWTFPAPRQLSAAMSIIGVPAGPWRWHVADDAPDVWSLL